MSNKDQNIIIKQPTLITKNMPVLLKGDELKEATNRLAEEIHAKMRGSQREVGTAYDNSFLELIEQLRHLDENLPWEESSRCLNGTEGEQVRQGLQQLRLLLSRRSQGRFVSFHERFATPEVAPGASERGLYDPVMCQGAIECMQWKGMPLFKTVFDFSIYSMMLWNVKPKTIIELGSGVGTSALWMADIMKTFELQCHLYSVDFEKVELQYDGISFIQGDCQKIEEVFAEDFLRNLPHPWLFIEDAHINVYGVLCYFHNYFDKGDYLVIEDSHLRKQEEIGKFLISHTDEYKIDTYYTDFFGGNATCSLDSIFVKT